MNYKKMTCLIILLFLNMSLVFGVNEDQCSIKKMVPGQDLGGGFFVEVECTCNTQIDLNFFDYDEGRQLSTPSNLFDCNTNGNKKGIGFSEPITQSTLIQVKGSIKNYSLDCVKCEAVEYWAYNLEKEQILVPDNSIIFVLIVLGVVSLVFFKENKKIIKTN